MVDNLAAQTPGLVYTFLRLFFLGRLILPKPLNIRSIRLFTSDATC